MSPESLYFCDIVPVVPIPLRNRQRYSYLSESVIPRGSLVMVPFGPRTVRGIVLTCERIAPAERPSGRFRYVKSIIRESFITDGQIVLAESISAECITPLGKTLGHFLPHTVKERAKTHMTDTIPSQTFRLTRDESDAVKTLLDPSDAKPFFLETDITTSLRITSGAKRDIGRRSQVLVLVPELIAIPFVERELHRCFGAERVATLSGSQSDGAYFDAWERIRSGQADIVIGTRQALFAPFRKLGLVVLLEEAEAVGYKQWDMSPRYDARRVAMTLARLHESKLLLAGSVEGLDTALRERMGEVRVLRFGEGVPDPPAARISTVDMRKERWKKNYSPISDELRDAVILARKDGRQVLLIVSRGGFDSFSVCVSCKEVPRCPDCDRALRSTREGGFRCPSCPYRTVSFPRCAKCGSLEFRTVGTGTEKIEREAARLFGGATMFRIDEKTFRKADRSKSYEAAQSAGILIGTPSVLNIGGLPKASLIAIMDADNFLSFPDYQADERFLRVISRAKSLIGRDGTVIVQTYRPERQLLQHIAQQSVSELMGQVSRDRESLRYPPNYRLFRISFRDTIESEAKRAAEDACDRFREFVSETKTVRISSPMKPLIPKVRGRYERSVLVTVPRETPFPEPLRNVLLDIRTAWTFDPDPISLT
ncbi:MAG TPA: primosomal protein N' [Candidatus Fimivivens sp.]|nr:primosomal protein N' [Candidatus Fimivivens sp.]